MIRNYVYSKQSCIKTRNICIPDECGSLEIDTENKQIEIWRIVSFRTSTTAEMKAIVKKLSKGAMNQEYIMPKYNNGRFAGTIKCITTRNYDDLDLDLYSIVNDHCTAVNNMMEIAKGLGNEYDTDWYKQYIWISTKLAEQQYKYQHLSIEEFVQDKNNLDSIARKVLAEFVESKDFDNQIVKMIKSYNGYENTGYPVTEIERIATQCVENSVTEHMKQYLLESVNRWSRHFE